MDAQIIAKTDECQVANHMSLIDVDSVLGSTCHFLVDFIAIGQKVNVTQYWKTIRMHNTK